MSKTVIKVENLSKQYRLGQVGTGTLSHDLNRWWHRVRGKEDPYLKIGETNDRSSKGQSEYVWALKDINFEVKEGEVLGIIGKNGAGKSTLLKILSKVTGPTTGAIKAKGRIASLLEVGTGFHPELTGRENIYLNGTILGMTKAEVKAKLDEIVAFAGVERYLDTPVKRYSSGMMVRLGFAVAAHLEPEILIVDEVLAVGDAEFQKKAIGKMQEVNNQGERTILFVSHDMVSIESLCPKAILLENGRKIFSGQSSEAIKKYQQNITSNSSLKPVIRLNKKIYCIKLLDALNNETSSFTQGGIFCIEVKFKVDTYINPIIGIVIKNDFGQNVLGLNNLHYSLNRLTPVDVTEGIFKIKFGEIKLREGTYSIDFFLSNSNTTIETIKDSVFFTIQKSSIFSNTLAINPRLNTFRDFDITWDFIDQQT